MPRRAYRLRAKEDLRPFFIIGSGRCGTTLLRRMLLSDDTVHIPPETYELPRAIERYRRHRRGTWPELVDLVLSTLEYHPEFEAFGVSLRPLAVELKRTPSSGRSLAHILDSFYRYHARSVGRDATRWGDKTPLNSFHLDLLDDVFPGAQYVHLVRDGVDVVQSMLKMGRGYTVHSAADRWSTAVAQCRDFCEKHPEASMQVRYEDLVQDPEEQSRAVCRFLGLAWTPQMLSSEDQAQAMGDVPNIEHLANVANEITASSIGRGRATLARSDLSLIGRLIGPQLRALGYPVP